MSIWESIGIIVTGCALNVVATMVLFHWRKRQEEPHEEIMQLTKDLIAVRERLRYIEGRMNGKGWLRPE
jgi:hypothetical protein